MKKLLYCILIVLTGCKEADLGQTQIENWVKDNTAEKEFSTKFNNGYGAIHTAGMMNINIKDIGTIEIDDETTRSVVVKISYVEAYHKVGETKTKDKNRTCRFIFKRSTDGKWYLSSIKGNRNKPFSSWMQSIQSKNDKVPL